MHNWEKEFQKWHQFEQLDRQLRKQLEELQRDSTALEDAFYEQLNFGTGGMRGVLGPGSNRMNIYTVRKAVEGLAHYVEKNNVNYKDRGVVVAYDSRYMSREFALEAAKILGKHGIKTYIFNSLRPTPLLSFAVRYLGTAAGIMITASHNPPIYNGFKVYNEQGSQITEAAADEIIHYISQVENELTLETLTEEQLLEKNLLHWLYHEIDRAYLKELKRISKFDKEAIDEPKNLRIVFTPLHGTALHLVTEGLKQLHFLDVQIVSEQAVPDPEFSTVTSPNPEEKQAFTEAIKLGKKTNADLLLATDPDADRLGVAVKTANGEYEVLTGNQLGALLLDYILRHTEKEVLGNARMIKTIVTSELGRAIASSYGVKTIDTLTGFKYIGEKINEFDTSGETFIFGYEESYGYLINGFSRDKDAVQAAVMACEMAAYWQDKGKTLLDALQDLFVEHGFYREGLGSLTLEGKAGQEKIAEIVEHFRQTEIPAFGTIASLYKEDYLKRERVKINDPKQVESLQLPKENVVKYILEDGCWVCLRPSGTEPKIKWYYGAQGKNVGEVEERYKLLEQTLHEIIVQPQKTATT